MIYLSYLLSLEDFISHGRYLFDYSFNEKHKYKYGNFSRWCDKRVWKEETGNKRCINLINFLYFF